MFNAPDKPEGHEDRSEEIQALLDQPLRKLADDAAGAGWSMYEVLNAMEELVQNYRLAHAIDPDPAEDPDNENSEQSADRLVEGFIDGRDLGP
ncbi:hypothetical protein ASG42_25270 [Rhizobium sp. Leaf391]|uniref:hypothetical protein n=1 Tax=Rhizobium sp. Leaf391 TaxID=1736360 RepID=UPI00071233B4|nr:hypothetical protein [Rhizobium sp. Leaf391]KQT02810.1 hypothetical protein ASG42_25270 [Rhizobium sp. Leaf391]